MSKNLTRVHIHYYADKFNYYTRFGKVKQREKLSPREAFEYYSRREIFGYIRWIANEYGTQSWRFFVLQAGDDATKICKIDGINPGAIVLADISGKDKIYRFFNVVDKIEASGINPCDVAPYYWVQVNARINSSLPALPYEISQHKAWLLERKTLMGSAKL